MELGHSDYGKHVVFWRHITIGWIVWYLAGCDPYEKGEIYFCLVDGSTMIFYKIQLYVDLWFSECMFLIINQYAIGTGKAMEFEST